MPQFIGPFQILKRGSSVAYQVALPPKLSNLKKKEIESQVHDLLGKEWIQKSHSPYIVPMLLVPKNDPKSVGDIMSFHGLECFYRRFVQDFSTLASHLNELMKKNVPFFWLCMLRTKLVFSITCHPQFDPFQVLKRINNNAYRLDLPNDYGVSNTFNVCDLTSFAGNEDLEEEPTYLKTSPLEEGEDDDILPPKYSITWTMPKRM
uniref:Tf2-1-like SH3-like domain-containing protein n=1 Tax=Cajanus cajan TaxID=3821 RepID=A0A151UBN9_CAJCA|nr:hypothetical protein KK1_020993 [Cajanus cajan]